MSLYAILTNNEVNDGTNIIGYPIVAPHYAAMISNENPEDEEKEPVDDWAEGTPEEEPWEGE